MSRSCYCYTYSVLYILINMINIYGYKSINSHNINNNWKNIFINLINGNNGGSMHSSLPPVGRSHMQLSSGGGAVDVIQFKDMLDTSAIFGNYSLGLSKALNIPTPSYVQIINDKLSVTSFSLLRKGSVVQMPLDDLENNKKLRGEYQWPNELSSFTDSTGRSVLLVPDGFLLPGQNNGGIYAVYSDSSTAKEPIRLTAEKRGWFYHKAMHLSLPGGQQGILTARAKKPLFGRGRGELVWLRMPDAFGSSRGGPWEETVLARGPDVMFEVFDPNPNDEYVSVIAAHFFEKKISVHSLRSLPHFPYVELSRTETIETAGSPYGLCLADMVADSSDRPSHVLVSTHECSYDIPSALTMALSALGGEYPRIVIGKLNGIRVGERLDIENQRRAAEVETGGSLFAYEIPAAGRGDAATRPPIDKWKRYTLFRGFKVRGWGGIFSPGAPGFPYVFRMPARPTSGDASCAPMILLAGDCTGSAYVFTPSLQMCPSDDCLVADGGCGGIPSYDLAFEVECGATVGSACVNGATDGSGDMELFIPSYELNKIHVYRLSDIRNRPEQQGVDVASVVYAPLAANETFPPNNLNSNALRNYLSSGKDLREAIRNTSSIE